MKPIKGISKFLRYGHSMLNEDKLRFNLDVNVIIVLIEKLLAFSELVIRSYAIIYRVRRKAKRNIDVEEHLP